MTSASLIAQIKTNCNISDAKFWGSYSICGLLMRFRDLFRHEKNIMPWENIDQQKILQWISDREHLWQEIANNDYGCLSIDSREYAPFDTEALNKALEEQRIIYGAGLGVHRKPSFFLAELISKEQREGYDIYITGDEFVRDLSAYPAMLQGTVIFTRRAVLSQILWNSYEEMKTHRHAGSLSYAFAQYGIFSGDKVSERLYNKILKIAGKESAVYIYHEIGEAFEGERLGTVWTDMLAEISDRRAELFVRSAKDILADTSEKGLLKNIIDNKAKGSLGFYISFLGGFRRIIFPEIVSAFADFTKNNDWFLIEEARLAGYEKSASLAQRLLSVYKSDNDIRNLYDFIEKECACKSA